MSDTDLDTILDMTERLFARHCRHEDLRIAETNGLPPPALWSNLAETGLLALLAPEAEGGANAQPSLMAQVLRIAGRHGAPGPLAETIICGWILPKLGLSIPKGPIMLAQGGLSTSVRYAPGAPLLVISDGKAKLVEPGVLTGLVTRNLAGEPICNLAGDLALIHGGLPAPNAISKRTGELLSLARAALILGALERTLELSLNYAGERIQFGRPIAAFQAIQQQLAAMAGAVAAASAITFAAARALDADSGGAMLDAARVRLADAIDQAAAIAHQVHGAIGFTREYMLQDFTRRLWSWRAEDADIGDARQRLAQAVKGADRGSLWPRIVELGASAR